MIAGPGEDRVVAIPNSDYPIEAGPKIAIVPWNLAAGCVFQRKEYLLHVPARSSYLWGRAVGLSWQQGPLSPGAIGRFLVPEPLPKKPLYVEPLRRRMR